MENDRKVYHVSEMPEELLEAIKTAQPSPEAEHLNHLMDDTPTGETPVAPEQVAVTQTVVSDVTTLNEPDPTSTTNPQGTRPAGQMSVLEMLQYELAQHARIALDYKNLIKTAKTDAKKHYYKKKLTKNNENALKILVALERITTSRARKNVVKPDPNK